MSSSVDFDQICEWQERLEKLQFFNKTSAALIAPLCKHLPGFDFVLSSRLCAAPNDSSQAIYLGWGVTHDGETVRNIASAVPLNNLPRIGSVEAWRDRNGFEPYVDPRALAGQYTQFTNFYERYVAGSPWEETCEFVLLLIEGSLRDHELIFAEVQPTGELAPLMCHRVMHIGAQLTWKLDTNCLVTRGDTPPHSHPKFQGLCQLLRAHLLVGTAGRDIPMLVEEF